MNDDQRRELLQAYGHVLKATGDLLTIWKAGLSVEEARKYDELEGVGYRIGIAIAMPVDRFIVQVTMLDPRDHSVIVLDTIKPPQPLIGPGESLAMN